MKRIALLGAILVLALLAAPALAGNSVTATGEILSMPAPVAAFSGSPLSGSVPLTVSFNAGASTGSITSYAWDFDNNGVTDLTTASPTASYTYAAAGTYSVKLTVTGPGGTDDELKTNYIAVTVAAPVAAFTGTPTSGYVPLTVQFTDQSTNTPTSWKWEYQKSGTSTWTQFATVQSPAYSFTATGTYSIRLTVTNAAGSNTLTKTNYITVSTPPAPVAAFIGAPTSGLTPLTVQFTDQSTNTPTSWKWEYKLGSGSWTQFSTAQSPSYSFTATGTYSIRLTATNAGGSNTLTKSNYITVSAPPKPVAAFTATPTNGMPPLAVQFTDQSTNTPTSWKWEYQKVGTSSWTQFSTAQNPAYTFAAAGQYSIRLTVTNAGGSSTLTKTGYITVGRCGFITPYFTGSPTSGSKPLTVQFTDGSSGPVDMWEWDFQNDGTYDSTVRNPSFKYTAKGTYSVKLRITNACATGTMIRYSYIKVT
ncbi:MAG TPA: PKD domain-containing protein [Methanomicrobiales archaeon]|nr:PKD domain-containing protein [Methanomicrobiales archaeon]